MHSTCSAASRRKGGYLRSLPKRSSISWMGTSRGRFLTYNVELGGVRVAIFFNYYCYPPLLLKSSDYQSAFLEFHAIYFLFFILRLLSTGWFCGRRETEFSSPFGVS